MRLASFNVENLFSRAHAMNLTDWNEGKPILAEYSRLNTLLQKPVYSAADKNAILASLEALGLKRSDESKFAILRQNHGRLVRRPKTGAPQIIANGRGDWIGWLELKSEAVDEVATAMTAKVIQEVNAEILAVVEAEDRIALKQFNNQLLRPISAEYSGIMLIDGNDERGIDVGIMTRPGYSIDSIVSHVDDEADGHPIFSRDCPEYTISNGTERILVLVNHLKSKGFGSPAASNARRRVQAQRVREIYDLRRAQGIDLIAIAGDFNDTPDSPALAPLMNSELKDIFDHPQFDNGGRPGTYGTCAKSNKIDYILLSPALFARVQSGGVCRKGIWGGTHGTVFEHYDEITKEIQAASDHAAIWAEINF